MRGELFELEETERGGLDVVERLRQTRGRAVEEVQREHRLVEPERTVSRVLDRAEGETERDGDTYSRVQDDAAFQKVRSRLLDSGIEVFRAQLRRAGRCGHASIRP